MKVSGRALGVAAFATAALGGAAMGWAGERRALRHSDPATEPEWRELRSPSRGREVRVESFDGTHLHAEIFGAEGDLPSSSAERGRASRLPSSSAERGRESPTVVLAHGYALSRQAWHYQTRELSPHFRVVTYDQRGHAASEEAASGDYSIEAFGRDLAAVINATAPTGPVVVVGHSLGGMTVLSYVDQFPEMVDERLAGVVLVSTSGSDVITGGIISVSVAAAQGLSNRLTRRAFQALGRRAGYADVVYSASNDLSYVLTKLVGLSADASPAHVAFTEQLLLDCPNNVKAAIGPLFTSLDLREAAPLVKVPALVIVGDRDRLTPPAQARRLVELLPDARLVELPGIGHMAPLEAHAEVTAHIRRFTNRVASR